ncbi:MAG: aroE, partial [Jatrophihabitantaceae bacterium]|nr:aroE [Jatrophihabitantaceae bacterium]
AAAADADLIVSTLPPGAANRYVDLALGPGRAVLDVVYAPWPTVLAAHAQDSGATVITGAAMLLHQAADQVRLMTGLEPPVAAMRAALRAVVAPGVV